MNLFITKYSTMLMNIFDNEFVYHEIFNDVNEYICNEFVYHEIFNDVNEYICNEFVYHEIFKILMNIFVMNLFITK